MLEELLFKIVLISDKVFWKLDHKKMISSETTMKFIQMKVLSRFSFRTCLFRKWSFFLNSFILFLKRFEIYSVRKIIPLHRTIKFLKQKNLILHSPFLRKEKKCCNLVKTSNLSFFLLCMASLSYPSKINYHNERS